MALYDHVDRSQICDHILRMRPCPSFFDAQQPCRLFHPEFILQNDIMLWTPRTWTCHAYQRRRDTWNRCWTSDIPNCGQLHRQGWEHSEMFAFRSWIASVQPRFWYSVYCLEPNISGYLPLYIPLTSKTCRTALPTSRSSPRSSISSMIGKTSCHHHSPTSGKSLRWFSRWPPTSLSQSVCTGARCNTVTPHPEVIVQHIETIPHTVEIHFCHHRQHQTRLSHAHRRDLAQARLLGLDNQLDQIHPTQQASTCTIRSSNHFWSLVFDIDSSRATTHCYPIDTAGANSFTFICRHYIRPSTACVWSRLRLECRIGQRIALATSFDQDFTTPQLGSTNLQTSRPTFRTGSQNPSRSTIAETFTPT